jgi:hypothetical protein
MPLEMFSTVPPTLSMRRLPQALKLHGDMLRRPLFLLGNVYNQKPFTLTKAGVRSTVLQNRQLMRQRLLTFNFSNTT